MRESFWQWRYSFADGSKCCGWFSAQSLAEQYLPDFLYVAAWSLTDHWYFIRPVEDLL